MNIACFELEGYEADDILGTLAKKAKKKVCQCGLFQGTETFCKYVQERCDCQNYRRR
ncbi:MAG: hypothetical protein ACLTM8_00345 [Veillonella parvula]